jgi:hypothetical protein
MILSGFPARAVAQNERTIELSDFGVVPRAAATQVLLGLPAVQQELKLSEAQKTTQSNAQKQRAEKMRKARSEMKDRAEFLKARDAIFAEFQKAQTATLQPEQRERLIQIQLQTQGPLAFTIRERAEAPADAADGAFIGPRLSEELKMSADQVKQARKLADDGSTEIAKAAQFQISLGSQDRPTSEAIRKLVGEPEFRAAKEKARRAAREAWTAVTARIDAVLNDEQRANYRKLLGKPFDLTKLRFSQNMSETDADVQEVRSSLGGGQRADPSFNITVARPTFTALRPKVLIDAAHQNFHTADGRYKPFADLMTNDGFLVSSNTRPLDSQTLGRCEILVIANASARSEEQTGRGSRSAFTDAECSAVQLWVWTGGALLLITDHEPFGSASEELARRFGVLMNTSGTADSANEDQKTGGLIFARESGLIVDHPITLGRDPSERIDRVQTFYGQALIGPVGSTGFLRFADSATYESDKGEFSAAGWAQGVASSYGAGRVVVMGEAAELSAQLAGDEPMGMNVPGIDNRQMALNIMHWLSRQMEPRFTGLPPGVIYHAPSQLRLIPRPFFIRPGQPLPPAYAAGR